MAKKTKGLSEAGDGAKEDYRFAEGTENGAVSLFGSGD